MVRVSSLAVDGTGLRLKSQHWGWAAIEASACRTLLVAASVKVSFVDGGTISAFGSPRAAEALHQAIESGRFTWASARRDDIRAGLSLVHGLLESDRYLGRHLVTEFRERHAALFGDCLAAARSLAAGGDADAAAFAGLLGDFEATIDGRNARWSEGERERWGWLFDGVEKTPLTSEQRKAVVDFEDRNLLVAAAGSGKTSTIVAKIAYAVRRGFFRPDEVLALAFNKKAAKELAGRIHDRLAKAPRGAIRSEGIRSETFHSLGYKILGEEKKRNVAEDRKRRIEEAFDRLRDTDPKFRRDVLRFIVEFTPDLRDRTEFFSYEEYLDYLKAAERRGGASGRQVPTLSGHRVASHEEMKIANWLFTHGVPFEYEKVYPHAQGNRERRGYTPDFYYPEIDVWHEHFGLRDDGTPSPCNGDPKAYLANIAWKRELHRVFKTRLMETTSAQFRHQTIYSELERQLRSFGQEIRELSGGEIEARLSGHEHRDLSTLIESFIAHWKSRRIPFERLMEQGFPRDRAFLAICKRVFDEYSARLRGDGRVDFDDLILGATDAIRSGAWRSPFRLILIDEFQDISRASADMVKALLSQHRDAVLFCVGDDWQAINGFAGSELAIMTRFEDELGFHVENKLTQTFRSNQGISSAAKAFVERNPHQKKKVVEAADRNRDDCLRILRYRSRAELAGAYESIAREIAGADGCTLKILGRYNRNEDPRHLEIFRRLAPRARVEFHTMHGAKGLEADYVVLDCLESSGAFAFPSTFVDDRVLRLVMPRDDGDFPHAEERRLMYVALTRARHRVFILVSTDSPSPFVRELEAQSAPSSTEPVSACPYCKNGARVRRNGKYGPFWSCSRYPQCDGKPGWPLRGQRPGDRSRPGRRRATHPRPNRGRRRP